ncbi:MAG TPA: hypothetical protein PKJ80_07150, partial [Candidatus Saccharicenans sp.]|nr:hypothetical protein [Candidatus Saccharicenans sp.]
MKSCFYFPGLKINLLWLLAILVLLAGINFSCQSNIPEEKTANQRVEVRLPDRLPARIADGSNKEI